MITVFPYPSLSKLPAKITIPSLAEYTIVSMLARKSKPLCFLSSLGAPNLSPGPMFSFWNPFKGTCQSAVFAFSCSAAFCAASIKIFCSFFGRNSFIFSLSSGESFPQPILPFSEISFICSSLNPSVLRNSLFSPTSFSVGCFSFCSNISRALFKVILSFLSASKSRSFKVTSLRLKLPCSLSAFSCSAWINLSKSSRETSLDPEMSKRPLAFFTTSWSLLFKSSLSLFNSVLWLSPLASSSHAWLNFSFASLVNSSQETLPLSKTFFRAFSLIIPLINFLLSFSFIFALSISLSLTPSLSL